MQILAMGRVSRRPALVEFTADEMFTRADFEREFEKTDNIVLSAKFALRRHAKRNGGLTATDDALIDHLSDGTLCRFGSTVREIGGVSTSAIGNTSSDHSLRARDGGIGSGERF